MRPYRSDSVPAKKLVAAFVAPNARMKVSAAVYAVSPKTRSASRGSTVRSWPIIPPTSALTPTSSANWPRFWRRPSRIGADVAVVVTRRSRAAFPVLADQSSGPPARTARSWWPCCSRMEAPVIARSPWPHITVIRPRGVGVVGKGTELDVDGARDVARLVLVPLADIDDGARQPRSRRRGRRSSRAIPASRQASMPPSISPASYLVADGRGTAAPGRRGPARRRGRRSAGGRVRRASRASSRTRAAARSRAIRGCDPRRSRRSVARPRGSRRPSGGNAPRRRRGARARAALP